MRKINDIYWQGHIFHLLNFDRIFGRSYVTIAYFCSI
jgi:hypothetical protein